MNPKPAPFFNYRKRQRQGIVSDPSMLTASSTGQVQTVNTNNSGSSSACATTLGNSPGYNQGQASPRQTPTVHQSRMALATSGRGQVPTPPRTSNTRGRPGLMDLRGKFNQGRPSTSSATPSFQGSNGQRPFNQASLSPVNTKGRGGYQSNLRGNSESSNFPQSKNFDRQNFTQNRTSTFSGNLGSNSRSCFTANSVSSTSSMASDSGNSDRRRALMSSSRGCNSGAPPRGSLGSRTVQSSRSGVSTTSIRGGFPTRGGFPSSGGIHRQQNSGQASGQYRPSGHNPGYQNDAGGIPAASMFSGEMQEDAAPRKTIAKPLRKVSKPPETQTDTSMRVFTCAITTIRQWTSMEAAPGIVMFEVFGILDSAILRTRDGTGKEFIIKDDSSKIKCVFYEIDRQLPKMTRGQVHRVIGAMDRKKDLLKVVSVRPAENGEREICQKATEVSEREMEKLARLVSEQ